MQHAVPLSVPDKHAGSSRKQPRHAALAGQPISEALPAAAGRRRCRRVLGPAASPGACCVRGRA